MSDTISIILEYLRRHHFSKAEAVLREEVISRGSNGLLPLQLDDDELDLDVSMHLQSVVQEKAAGLGQQTVLKFTHDKVGPDTEKYVPMELKQGLQGWLGSEKEEKLHLLNADKLQPLPKVEEPGILFTNFKVEEQEQPVRSMSSIGSTSPLVIFPPVSVKQLSERLFSPTRWGGLGILQTSAELTATSSDEAVPSDQKIQSFLSAVKSTGVSNDLPFQMDKELATRQDEIPPPVMLESLRGKVESLKQRWEPKTTEDPMLHREKGRAMGLKNQVENGKTQQEGVGKTNNNGLHTAEQALVRTSLIPGFTEEADLVYYGKKRGGEFNAQSKEKSELENGFQENSSSGSKCVEWTDIPIKTIPIMKTNVSLATEPANKTGNGGSDVVVREGKHLQDVASDKEWYQTASERDLTSQASSEQGSVSQVAVAGLVQSEGKRQLGQQWTQGEKHAQNDHSKKTAVIEGPVEGELPKLPPVRLRSNDPKTPESGAGVGFAFGNRSNLDTAPFEMLPLPVEPAVFGLGSYLDVPVGQDISSSGSRRLSASARPSVSHGIVEDMSELLSGFATVGDGQSESAVDYPDDYWDSDTYEDDDDPGYHRQPIEDEEWFLAHEIDYPSEDERAHPSVEKLQRIDHEKDSEKDDDDNHSCIKEEQSFFSGEEYYRGKRGDEWQESERDLDGLHTDDLFGHVEGGELRTLQGQLIDSNCGVNQVEYERPHLDSDALTLMRGEPGWQGFESLKEGFPEQDGSDKSVQKRVLADGSTYDGDDDRVGSVRFSGLGVRSDVAEFGSELRGSLLGGSSEGDLENAEIGGQSVGQTSASSQMAEIANGQDDDQEEDDEILRYYENPWTSNKHHVTEMETSSGSSFPFEPQDYRKLVSTKLGTKGIGEEPFHKNSDAGGGSGFGGFSFPSPSTSGGDIATVSRVDSGKSLWSVRDISAQAPGEEGEDFGNGLLVIDDPLASWRRKSNDSSPKFNMGDRAVHNIDSDSTDGYGSGPAKQQDEDDQGEEHDEDALLEDDQHIRDAEAVAAEDEEAAAVQEQIRRIQAEEDEFETFNLKIIHRKNRTGFEEDKDFPVVLNAVIAGRYHVTEYLGSAAFSKAIQAHDLHTGMDVCMKIIKNNKDFFDQSLDEIKLLKYINKNDPVDKHHLLRLYDYFYHREHLFIVCELLRANLYEFHKYNRESGGEVYFTMPRLQSITRQCLEALEFIHGLGLIHCDLKPENILVKSYSRCEIKVIDLGSSCFQTDHLCSYVQSRSYRAPEVILGLPYNQKIDMWSLGCILAELCSGNVLFQNDSLATLLARVVGILGPIDPALLAKGKDTHKFFTKNHMLYERNQDSDQLEYLLPKKTSLAHRLPMGDQGFVEFVAYLLQIDPTIRPSATEALQHPWLSYPYEPISS